MRLKLIGYTSLIVVLLINACKPPEEKAETHYENGKNYSIITIPVLH
jgi:hypothetical protein